MTEERTKSHQARLARERAACRLVFFAGEVTLPKPLHLGAHGVDGPLKILLNDLGRQVHHVVASPSESPVAPRIGVHACNVTTAVDLDGSDRAKEQRFDAADLLVKFVERLAIPPKNERSERRRSSGSLPIARPRQYSRI